jgi:hypothetical protein
MHDVRQWRYLAIIRPYGSVPHCRVHSGDLGIVEKAPESQESRRPRAKVGLIDYENTRLT